LTILPTIINLPPPLASTSTDTIMSDIRVLRNMDDDKVFTFTKDLTAPPPCHANQATRPHPR